MITHLMLGQHGRLGNQMFQYAMLTGLSKKNNYTVAIPKQNQILTECFEISCKSYDFSMAEKIIKNMNYYREKYFHFNENIFELKDNIIFSGNFQSEKYFLHCKEEIKKQFCFKKNIQNNAQNFINTLRQKYNKKIVSVHIRRGDYLAHKNSHPTQSIEWYEKCFNLFGSEALYIIFSDDKKWCEENFKKNNIKISNLNSDYEELCAMSLCDCNIIANSSFSWWGAWLNNNSNKTIIAPKKWFGPDYFYHQTHDIYCKDWIQI